MKPKEEAIDDDEVQMTGQVVMGNHSGEITNNDCDDLSDDPESGDSTYDDTDLLANACHDDITAQLAAAGPVGVAAAAAIATAKKRKRPHSFETNPSIRKRQQTRLLRKLKATIDEYTTRVGQQAVVLIITPGKPQNNYKVFGARPLENVVRNCRTLLMSELEQALAQQAPPQVKEDPSLHELPPLVVDGIPTPVEKMTQAQLRAFIPLMLKYSTGRGKPGWGKESTRPMWWPKDLPWANVRSDARTEEEKQKVSWTHALRQIVINCYKHHGREDLLPAFSEDESDKNGPGKDGQEGGSKQPTHKVKSRTINHATSINLVNTMNSGMGSGLGNVTTVSLADCNSALAQQVNTMYAQPLQYAPTMMQAINNPDGTVSIVQIDPNSHALVTLPDGSQAQVRAISSVRIQGDANSAVQTLADMSGDDRVTQIGTVNVDLGGGDGTQVATLAEATIGPDGQIILTQEDGTQSTFPVSGMVTIPVSMYQTVVTNIQNLGEQGIPVTMSALTAAATDASQDQEMEVGEDGDVKMNGNQTVTGVVEES